MSTIAVELTGRGIGAIAVVMLTGDAAGGIIDRIAASPRAHALNPGQAAHSTLVHPDTREAIDDAMIVATADRTFELHVHGGRAVVAAVLAALLAAGAEIVGAQEAARRGAFGQGLAADLPLALPLAKNLTAARLLAAQTDTGLTAWSLSWQNWLLGKTANDLWRLHSAAQSLLERSKALSFLLEPARVAIIGPPNAGKSTLANALLGRPVAITSEIAGTTRDWVDALATFTAGDAHVPVLLVDTAGIRETADTLEQESIARTHQQAHAADVVIVLLDASHPLDAKEMSLTQQFLSTPTVLAANKIDLPGAKPLPGSMQISAKLCQGLDALMTAVLHQLDLAIVDTAEPFAFCDRQLALLQAIAESTDPATALGCLTQLR